MKKIIEAFVIVVCFLYGGKAFCEVRNGSSSLSTHPLVTLSDVLSDNDRSVRDQVKLYITDSSKYFKKNEDDLSERWIESHHEITPEMVIIDELRKKNKIVFLDLAENPTWALSKIIGLTGARHKEKECYSKLNSVFKKTKYGIGTFLQQPGYAPSVSKCVEAYGYYMVGIDDGSDSYSILLVKYSLKPKIESLVNKTDLKLNQFY